MQTPNHSPARRRKQGVPPGRSDESFFTRRKGTLLAVLFAVHVLATLFFFHPADVLNKEPVLTLDHAFHYYQAWRAREVFFETGRLHAYDPYLMAGFPSALFDLDVKSLEAFCAFFPKSQTPRAMKIYILACYLSMVFTVYGGCRLLRLTEREALLAAALALVFWHWGRPYASHFRYAGMFNFIFVSHLSILAAGLFRRFFEEGKVLWWLVLGPLAYFIHPTAVVILLVPYLCAIFCGRRAVTPRTLLLFALWCAVVVLVNSIWIVPLLHYASFKTATQAYFQTSGIGELARLLWRPGCLPAIVLLALAVPGCVRLAAKGRRQEAATLGLSVVFLLFIAAYGVFLPGVRHLEPGRFLLAAVFFSAPLAGAGAALALDGWERLSRRAPAALAAAAVAALTALLLAPIALSYLSSHTGYRHRIRTTLTGEVIALVEAVEDHTDRSGRLMIEDGPASLYDEVHLPGYLPVRTRVEQIGGPYPHTFLQHHFATFQRDRTMGRRLSEIPAEEFWYYADLYNIRWIAAASDEAKDFVLRIASDGQSGPASQGAERSAPVVEVWRSERYVLWRVERAPSFTGCEGDRVTASFNEIRIELAEDRDSFLLRYHWDDGLEASLPAKIAPAYAVGDPVPFIMVEPNGVRSIILTY